MVDFSRFASARRLMRVRRHSIAALATTVAAAMLLLPAPEARARDGTATAPTSASGAEKPAPSSDGPVNAGAPAKAAVNKETIADAASLALFLDRLMIAESGGRDDARNPRSTAVGPFQFIVSTFLEVTRRHFAEETSSLTPAQVLQLRTNRAFARRAAEAFTRDNAAHLALAGLEATFPNLRLAFLVGPSGAVRVLRSAPTTPAATILGAHVIRANPFLVGMTTGGLAQWSARNLSAASLASGRLAADVSRIDSSPAPRKPAIAVRCNRGLPSCRRWVSLATKRANRARVVATPARRAR